MIVKRKLAAHQIGVCWALPAEAMQGRSEEELCGKGTQLLVKDHFPPVGGGLANTSGSGVCAPRPRVQQSNSLPGVQVLVTAIEMLVCVL